MTLKETLDGFKEAVEKQTSTVNGYSAKIDGLAECQAAMRSDIKEIKIVLAGDDFGNEGLVKNHGKLKITVYTIIDDIKRFKTIWYVIAGLVGTGLILMQIFI